MRCRVRAIVKQGDTLLLVRHNNPRTGKPYDTWVLPGGGIDEGEMLLDAMTREMTEETGIAPVIGNLLYVHQFKYEGAYQGPEFFFNIENVAAYQDIDLTKTSHGVEEIAEIGFFDPRELDVVLPEFLKDVDAISASNPTQVVIRHEGDSY